MAGLQFTASKEGPLVVLPLELAECWRGVKGDPSDFDRACDDVQHKVVVAGWVEAGTLPVEEGLALVLDGDTEAAFIPTNEGCLVVRGATAMSEEEVKARTAKVPKADWVRMVDTLELMEGRLVMFDAAARGHREPAKIDAESPAVLYKPGAGKYKMECAAFENADGDPVSLVRLTRI